MLLPPLPGTGIVNWQFFTAQQDGGVGRFNVYLKPPGASTLVIIVVGPGGGGGGGQSTAGGARSGGGGGGSGSITRVIIPAFLLPDTLYVSPANGGAGGAAVSSGFAGISSFVGVAPSSASNSSIVCLAQTGLGGAATSAGGTAGAANTGGSFNSLGLILSSAGQAGANGGANTGAIGSNETPSTSLIVTGGGGGASSSTLNTVFAGGDISSASPATGIALWRTIPGGAAGVSGSAAGSPGQPGQNHGVDIGQSFSRSVPLLFSGGSGGGSGGASNGGKGGPGAWGCGGGGGGAGATGGGGGNGGDGFVIIGAF